MKNLNKQIKLVLEGKVIRDVVINEGKSYLNPKGKEELNVILKRIGEDKKEFGDFLIKMDSTGEEELEKKLFGNSDEYIDSPGFYQIEKKDYKDIFEFYYLNADLNSWYDWYKENKEKVNKFMGNK